MFLGDACKSSRFTCKPERLRFDFSHFGQVTPEELEQIEKIVNEKIWRSITVEI